MGQPAEVYLYGPQLWMFGLASFFCIPIVGYIFIPFYCKMQFTSAYEVMAKWMTCCMYINIHYIYLFFKLLFIY